MPGALPKGKIKIEWSPDFAYAIGLIVADGCIYGERHVAFVSKDFEQINNYKKCLKIDTKSFLVYGEKGSMAYKVQFGDVLFCNFLNSIGITKAKSLTIGSLEIPDQYFFDFLRGEFDGDGCTYSYWDKRWKSSFMLYVSFASGSKIFLEWLCCEISKKALCHGRITAHRKKGAERDVYQLRYAKNDSITLYTKMYHSDDVTHLSRKKLKFEQSLGIIGLPQNKWY